MNFNTYQPKIRMKAFKDAPLRSSEDYQIGFYDIGVLRDAMDHRHFSEYRIASLPIPQNDEEMQKAENIIRHPSVEYAIVDKNKLVITLLDGQSNGWMSTLNNMGYTVKGGGKSAKRMKSFHRPTLLNAHYDNLNIKIAEPTEYTKYIYDQDAPEYNDPDILERLLDGCFIVSSRIMAAGIENLPVYEPSNSTDTDEYYYDPNIRRHLQNFLATSKVYNARILCDLGIIKGNMIVSDNLPLDIDVITSAANIKKEVIYKGGYRLLAEPQGPKSRVITDDQTVINFPKLFRKSDMEMWLKEEYEKMFQDAINGKLLQNWKSVYTRMWRDSEDIEDKEEKQKLFQATQTIPCVKQKAEWAQKWIESTEEDFATRLIGFAVVEGIFFSGSFCAIYWLKERGLMPGLTTSNEFIARDEGLHTDFACALYEEIERKLPKTKVHKIIREAVKIEKQFITESLPCRLVGMNDELMARYIEFVADRLSSQLGYGKIYSTQNPFDFMERISLEGKDNFFEKRVTTYAKAGVGKKQDEMSFSLDADF
jgi:ribonucleotide reductase beta subunit family protein with ferritin-like domain